MQNLPTLRESITLGSIIVVSLIAGYIFKKIFLKWLIRLTAKTKWKGDDIIVDASKNVIILFFLIGGLYIATLYFPSLPIPIKNYIFKFLHVSTALLVTIIISRVLVGWVNIYQQDTDSLLHKTSILKYVIRTIIYVIGGLVIMQVLGIPIAPILTALGVGGLAVALALQDTLSNLFAGLQILAAKNIHPGDYLKLENGDEGYIVDINWRSTTIRALANRIIIIPNHKLASSVINNFSKPDKEIAVLIDVGVSYSSDLEKVEKVTIEVGAETLREVTGGVIEFQPFIRYNKFDAYSINFTVILRAKEFTDQYLIKHEFVKRLQKRYNQEGIEIPFPITTVLLPEKPAKGN